MGDIPNLTFNANTKEEKKIRKVYGVRLHHVISINIINVKFHMPYIAAV